MFKFISLSALFLGLAALASADHGKGAVGGKTITPRTLHEEDFSLETGFRYQKSESLSDQRLMDGATNGHDIHSVDWLADFSVAVAEGAADQLTLSLPLPFHALPGFPAREFDGVNPAPGTQ